MKAVHLLPVPIVLLACAAPAGVFGADPGPGDVHHTLRPFAFSPSPFALSACYLLMPCGSNRRYDR